MFLVDPTGRMKLHPRNDVLPEVQEETKEEMIELERWKGDVNIIDISTDSSDEEDDIASIELLQSMTKIKNSDERVCSKSLVPVGGTGSVRNTVDIELAGDDTDIDMQVGMRCMEKN